MSVLFPKIENPGAKNEGFFECMTFVMPTRYPRWDVVFSVECVSLGLWSEVKIQALLMHVWLLKFLKKG